MKQGFISDYKGTKKQYIFILKDSDNMKFSKKKKVTIVSNQGFLLPVMVDEVIWIDSLPMDIYKSQPSMKKVLLKPSEN